jgi:hypothetical protein
MNPAECVFLFRQLHFVIDHFHQHHNREDLVHNHITTLISIHRFPLNTGVVVFVVLFDFIKRISIGRKDFRRRTLRFLFLDAPILNPGFVLDNVFG